MRNLGYEVVHTALSRNCQFTAVQKVLEHLETRKCTESPKVLREMAVRQLKDNREKVSDNILHISSTGYTLLYCCGFSISFQKRVAHGKNI